MSKITSKFLEELLESRANVLQENEDEVICKLAEFTDTSMKKDSIWGTPFREFESVPQGRVSRRKQNDSLHFDPYLDTLFDYPFTVGTFLGDPHNSIERFNYHLTVQIPTCRMDCWHCYNDKTACASGHAQQLNIPVAQWSVQKVLTAFAETRREGQRRGRHYNVLRVSGGEPFLVPEFIAELHEAICAPNADADYPQVIWTETNLTPFMRTADGVSLFDHASASYKSRHGKSITDMLSRDRGRLIIHPCFHGLTSKNISETTGIPEEYGLTFQGLVEAFRLLHELRIPLYPTFLCEASDPAAIKELFSSLYRIDKAYPLRVALISADFYDPIKARFITRVSSLPLYTRQASLSRWQSLIRTNYCLDYPQVPRALAFKVAPTLVGKASEHVEPSIPPTAAAPFDPMLILHKSVSRPEYRQEILTIIASPQGATVVASYDVKHVEPILLEFLKADAASFVARYHQCLISYAYKNTDTGDLEYLPLRICTVVRVTATDTVVSFQLRLEGYLTSPKGPASYSDSLNVFSSRIKDYFGSMLSGPSAKWVFLGELALMTGWEKDGLQSEAQSSVPSVGWQCLVDVLKSASDSRGAEGLRELRARAVFAELVIENGLTESYRHDGIFQMNAGDTVKLRLRYYIPDFDYYEGRGADASERDSRLKSRTLCVRSSEKALVLQGFAQKPLAKYGYESFELHCGQPDADNPAQVVIEAADGSCNAPRIVLEFRLKKAAASDD